MSDAQAADIFRAWALQPLAHAGEAAAAQLLEPSVPCPWYVRDAYFDANQHLRRSQPVSLPHNHDQSVDYLLNSLSVCAGGGAGGGGAV